MAFPRNSLAIIMMNLSRTQVHFLVITMLTAHYPSIFTLTFYQMFMELMHDVWRVTQFQFPNTAHSIPPDLFQPFRK